MPKDTARLENMLFDYGTTNKTNYRSIQLTPAVLTKYKEKGTCLFIRPPPLPDVHTLTPWKSAPVPFGLLHRRKAVVNEDPKMVPAHIEKCIDKGKEEAQRTRPRLVMTPAVAMDDIADPKARKILIKDMYTSSMSRAYCKDSLKKTSVSAPFPGLPAPANPIVLPKLQPNLVAPEWRKETITWDSKQMRTYCDPTKEFWLKYSSNREGTKMIAGDRK